MAESNNQENKAIAPSKELGIILKSSELARRGLDLISQLQPRILHVPSEFISVEDAVAKARNGDIIEVAPGEYEVNVQIDKSITIRGENQDVKFLPWKSVNHRYGVMDFPKDAPAIIEIANPKCEVELQNIQFNTYDAINFPPAINVAMGSLIIDNCRFDKFEMSFDVWSQIELNYPDAEVIRMLGRRTISIFGSTTEFIIRNSTFNNCVVCLEVDNIYELIVDSCRFVQCNYGIILSDSIATVRDSLFLSGVALQVYGNSKIESSFDTYYKNSEMIYLNGNGRVSLNHVTIDAGKLLDIGPRTISLAIDDKAVILKWEEPHVSISDSIVILKSSLLGSYSPMFSQLESIKNGNIFNSNLVINDGANFINSYPNFVDGNPMFGDLVGNKLTLLPGSPAIGAASDGLNLGAWQGS